MIRKKTCRKFLPVFLCILILTAIVFCYTHRTHYLNYDYEFYSTGKIHHIGVGKGINLKINPEQGYYSPAHSEPIPSDWAYWAFPDQTIITDKAAIKKIMEYLNSIPFVSAPKDAAPSPYKMREDPTIRFYDENSFETGWIIFRGEEYIVRSLDEKVFKVRDEGTKIVTGLESLEF